jgi:hypothetical protein
MSCPNGPLESGIDSNEERGRFGQSSRGHWLVNWATCTRPKKWGGLGIKDLEKFGRTLKAVVALVQLGHGGAAMEEVV